MTHSSAWPRIVAEALRRVSRPPKIAVPVCAPLATTLAVVENARRPVRSMAAAPEFLHSHQRDAWRRVIAALEGWHGALLLESVGTGKTWIALAVAAAYARGGVVAIVPAIVRAQWADAAARAGVTLHLWTHERASRGALPAVRPSLVVIDEAHRFRDATTRRARTVAPWLVGRRTLMLTATPIVNRLDDLITLMRIVVPEDALALDGISRLAELENHATPPAALRRIAIRTPRSGHIRTERNVTTIQADPAEGSRAARAIAAIEALELSGHAPIRRLLTSVLLDAAASSDAAFHQALKRYRALLLQARDAGGASRAMLRQFAGESLEQTVLWPLLKGTVAPDDLPLGDIARIEQLLTASAVDGPWIAELTSRCADQRPTICFTRHRATAHLLRVVLGEGTAWVTGSEAGIGPHRVGRAAVLGAFGSQRESWNFRKHLPRILIATDVAAEGLDLHAAGRIVHVDLPWTATRIEQREGRLLRLGQQHTSVEVIVRLPAPAIEAALMPQARLQRKEQLADRWLHALEAEDDAQTVLITAPPLTIISNAEPEAGFIAVKLERDGRTGVVLMPQQGLADVADEVAVAVRNAVAVAGAADGSARALVSRIHRLARTAAAKRDGPTLQQLDRLLRFVTASPTLGARMMISDLVDAADRDFLRADVPDVAPASAVRGIALAMALNSPIPLR